MNINYADNDYSQGFCQIKEAFKCLTEAYLLQPYESHQKFGSTNKDNAVGYFSYVCDMGYEKKIHCSSNKRNGV